MHNYTQLITRLYQIGAIQFGNFTLKSGKKSSVYINLRKIVSYPDLLSAVANTMMQKIPHVQFDLICGVPYTALPIATCMSIDYNIPMIMRRKEKKDHGTKQIIEGVFQPGQKCLVVEDVVTSGTSILETVTDLEAAGLVVKDVIALVDREQGGRETLTKCFQFHSIIRFSDILSVLAQSAALSSEEKTILHAFKE